ncbi:hypothetical protein A7318_17565 [Pseudomonas lurida]|nr:hypothetical protein A7318_17565 [Pseudomonas lurida]
MLVLVFMLVVAFVLLTIRPMTALIIRQVVSKRATRSAAEACADRRASRAAEAITDERASSRADTAT